MTRSGTRRSSTTPNPPFPSIQYLARGSCPSVAVVGAKCMAAMRTSASRERRARSSARIRGGREWQAVSGFACGWRPVPRAARIRHRYRPSRRCQCAIRLPGEPRWRNRRAPRRHDVRAASEGCPAQRSQVMIAKHRDNGQARCREELASRLGFQEASVLGEVPGNQQKVGPVREAGRPGTALSSSRPRRWRSPMAAIRTRIHWRRRAGQPALAVPFHGGQGYPIGREARKLHRILSWVELLGESFRAHLFAG